MKLKILNEEVDINVIYHFIDNFIKKPFMQDKIAHNFEKLVLVIGPNYNTKDKIFPDNTLEITGVIKYPEINYFSRDIFVDEYNDDLYNFLGYTSRYIGFAQKQLARLKLVNPCVRRVYVIRMLAVIFA